MKKDGLRRQKRGRRPALVAPALGLVMLLALVAASCGGDDSAAPEAPPPAEEPAAPADEPAAPAEEPAAEEPAVIDNDLGYVRGYVP